MLRFRDATIEDLPAIVVLLADDVLGETRESIQPPLAPEYAQAFADIKRQSGNRLIVATNAQGLIKGCLQLTFTPGIARKGLKRATIEGVRIAKDSRGTGAGAKLVEYAVCEARAAKCGLVQLTTDRTRGDAHRFYEKIGFEPSHIGMKLAL